MDAFTSRPEVYEFAKIDKATNHIPPWWKNLPKVPVSFENIDSGKQTNMKHCIGFIDYFKNSFVIPMWSDLNLMVGKEGTTDHRWQFADKMSSLKVHPANQRGVYLNEVKYQHFKLETPWAIKTNKLVYFSWSGATWNTKEPEKIIYFPAVIDFYNQTALNINIACRRSDQEKEILIPLRQPLVHILPMTEKEIILKTHLVSEIEMLRIRKATYSLLSFSNSYLKLKRIKNAT